MKTTLSRLSFLVLLANSISGCGTTENNSVKNDVEQIRFPVDKFSISAETDTTVFGVQGTRIFIEKETFQFSDGTLVTDSIKIELKEFYKKSDIILADLSTESNGEVLETAGMIYITATSGGKPLEIRSDKRIVVHFPKKNGDNYRKMNLFYADQNATDSSVNNWEIDTVSLAKRTLKLGSYGWWYPSYHDSTEYNFIPKNYVDTGYYWNPLDFYVTSFDFSEETKKEVEATLNKNSYPKFVDWNDYGVECEMRISVDGDILDPRINTKVSSKTRNELLGFLNNLPQLEPGKNKAGKIIERRGLLFIQGGEIIPLYKTEEEYVKSFDKKYAQYEKTPIKTLDDAELNYYVFSVSKLGWINCDRFINSENKTDLIVEEPLDNNTKLKLIFGDIDGVMMANVSSGKYVFSNVPSGGKGTIFATRNKDGKLETSFKEITISDKPIESLSFKETTLGELKKELDKFN